MDKGLKRLCASCGTKFYDFNKSPIICPSCDTEFTGVVKIRTRRSRLLTADTAKPAGLDEESTEVEAENDNISLDDLADEEDTTDEDEDTDVDLDDLDDDTDEDDDDFDDDDEDLEDLDEEDEDEGK